MDSKIKYILFDFDGTIANTFDYYRNLLKKQDYYGIDDQTTTRFRGMNFWDVITELKIPLWKLAYLAWILKNRLNKDMELIAPFEGIYELLKLINSKGIGIGILSINSKKNIEKFCKHNVIEPFIDDIWSVFILSEKDPAIGKILKTKKLQKEEMLYVGDEIRDIKAAKKAGIKIAAVTWGANTSDSLINNSPDYIINSPKELELIL